jgi:prolyl oligopeptidase
MKLNPLILITGCLFVMSGQNMPRLNYPVARKGGQTDVYHEVQIADPYRGLENADAPETRKWVEEENALTQSWVGKRPDRGPIRKQLTKLWNYEKFETLFKAGLHYFYLYNTGLQNQSAVFVTDLPNAKGKELLDPNTYRKDGTAALSGWSVSRSGKLYGYAIAQAGSDWSDCRIRDVASGKDLPDVIRWTKFTNMAWATDEGGFYYSRYPEPPTAELLTAAALNQRVYFHKLGDPQAADRLVYERPDHPAWSIDPVLTDDGRYLLLIISSGIPGKNMLSFQDMQSADRRIVDLIPTETGGYQPIEAVGSTLYVQTTDGAPRGRVIAIDLQKPVPSNWREIVPEAAETLDSVQMADGKLLLAYMRDAHAAARLVTTEGKPVAEVAMPGLGTAMWSPARVKDKEMFYGFMTYAAPTTMYRLDLETGRSEVVRPVKLAFDASGFETTQVFYASKDGSRIPMFLTKRRGLKLDGQNPALLYGYGGFDVPNTPGFSPIIAEWIRMGGVFASACLRGGSEYGEEWHQAGMRAKKQNVFNDFIAAAEWLIANRYTSTPKLAIMGGSNGGLLVGAVLNQRPDLFGAAVAEVGVMDMLRFQKFGFGTQWVGEYGSPENPEDFKVLRAYSPLHNIRAGTEYPAVLVTTSDHDDRVMPGHSLKYTATLQQAQKGPAPILLRVETRAGHGAGKPTAKQIDEAADILTFLKVALKVNWASAVGGG